MPYQLGVTDCLVIALMLSISAGISIKCRLSGVRQNTTNEYLMAGRNMAILPVILSTSVTLVSAVSMLGTPSEIYRYGFQNIVMVFSLGIGMALASFVFVPVFFQCGVSTVYEVREVLFTIYFFTKLYILRMKFLEFYHMFLFFFNYFLNKALLYIDFLYTLLFNCKIVFPIALYPFKGFLYSECAINIFHNLLLLVVLYIFKYILHTCFLI